MAKLACWFPRVLALTLSLLAIAQESAAQNPWETTEGVACIERWIADAMARLNAHNGNQEFNRRKPWSINRYGVLEGNAQFGPRSTAAPDDFPRYGNNRYWWVWVHYQPAPNGWRVREWNDARIEGVQTRCPAGAAPPPPAAGRVPLKLYWHAGRGDNFTTATAQGEADARAAGYTFIRIEGYVFASQQPGTVALLSFWGSGRGDNFTTATAQGEADARAAGYAYLRVEGYVYPSPQPGTVPLRSYWHAGRGDNFTAASAQGAADARAAGYTLLRTEGYAFPP